MTSTLCEAMTSKSGAVNKIKRRGPTTDPCGTPNAKGEGFDIAPSRQ